MRTYLLVVCGTETRDKLSDQIRNRVCFFLNPNPVLEEHALVRPPSRSLSPSEDPTALGLDLVPDADLILFATTIRRSHV
jgi:hypothetical protein